MLLPVLGERYGRALTSGTLAIARGGAVLEVRAGDLRFPLAPHTLGGIVRRADDRSATLSSSSSVTRWPGSAAAQPRDVTARRRRHRDKAGRCLRGSASSAAGCRPRSTTSSRRSTPIRSSLDAILEAQSWPARAFERRRRASRATAGSSTSPRYLDLQRRAARRVLARFTARDLQLGLGDSTIDGVCGSITLMACAIRRVYPRRPRNGRVAASESWLWIVVEKIRAPASSCSPAGRSAGPPATTSWSTLGALLVDPDGGRR